MSAVRSLSPTPSKESCHRLAARQSPCYQRRLSGLCQCLIPIALPRESVFPKAISLATSIAAISHWLAPEGAKPVECSRHRPRVAKGKEPVTLGSWPEVSRRSSVRRFTAAAAFIAGPSQGAISAGCPTRRFRAASAPTHRSSGAAPKAAQPAQLKRYA